MSKPASPIPQGRRTALRVRLSSWLYSAARRLDTVAWTLHHGFWLGLLDRRTIHQLAAYRYSRARRYQEPEHNLSGLYPWEEAAIDKHFGECRRILIGGVGGGREALALARRDFEVTAFDCVPDLLAAARRLAAANGLEITLLDAEPDRLPAGIGRFDGAIIGWGAYMHIPGREARVALLRELRGVLPAGGPVLLSFYSRGPDSRSGRWIRDIGNFLRRLRFETERVELGDTLAGTFDHRFTEGEVQQELAAGGFETVSYSHEPYGVAVGRAV